MSTPAAELAVAPVTPTPETAPVRISLSPNQRAWARFKRNRLGYVSLWILAAMLVVSVVEYAA